MAAKHLTLGDLMFGTPRLDIKSSRRFDVLNKPFIFECPAGLSRQDTARAAASAGVGHRTAMIRLLREQAGLPSTGSLSPGQTIVLLNMVLMIYVPAFGETELAPAKRPVGRPASGLTARQKAAIEARPKGETVISACRRQVRGKDRVRKAKAMAAAWRRLATKTMKRRN